jgi:hypothetical protein
MNTRSNTAAKNAENLLLWRAPTDTEVAYSNLHTELLSIQCDMHEKNYRKAIERLQLATVTLSQLPSSSCARGQMQYSIQELTSECTEAIAQQDKEDEKQAKEEEKRAERDYRNEAMKWAPFRQFSKCSPHICRRHCRHECDFGGPGPHNFCRECDIWSKRFNGECQHCVCLAKAQQRDTPHKHAVGGTCSAYMDGTKCEC